MASKIDKNLSKRRKKIFFRHSFWLILLIFKPSLIMIGQVNSVLSNFCCFLLKNVIFWFRKYCFWLFWATWIFWFKNIFSVSFQTNFFWFFKLSTISVGQLSSILSNFLWFFASKITFLLSFSSKKIFFEKNFFFLLLD